MPLKAIIAASMPRVSIAQTFANLRSKEQIALMPFIPAGYPSLAATEAILPALEAGGASLIEIGVPFSDPVADGPIIQAAFTEALKAKIKVADVFAVVKKVRDRVSIPMLAMLSYSIVFRHGVEKFTADAKAAGFDGLIIPDLPPPEAQKVVGTIQKGGLDTVLLVAPSTTQERRKEIADLSSGFVYYLSVAGITGERTALPSDLAKGLAEMKRLSDRPVCVGFGINTAEHVKQLAGSAEGAIVGSAVVRRINAHKDKSPDEIANVCESYCRELLAQVR
jgi:tryptophan synthase alpha chain